jgi:hypothetical protein
LVNGYVHIIGLLSENHRQKVKSYTVAYRPVGSTDAIIINQGHHLAHDVGLIGVWDSRSCPDGPVELMLTVVYKDGHQAKHQLTVTKGQWTYVGELNNAGQPLKNALKSPFDAAIDQYGSLFVSDKQANRINKYSNLDHYLFNFGEHGKREGEFQEPTHLTIDSQNRLVVVDKDNRRLQLFDLDGQWLAAIDGPGFKAKTKLMLQGQLGKAYDWAPVSVTTGPDGRIYVLDEQGVIYRLDDHDQPQLISHPQGNGYVDLAAGEVTVQDQTTAFFDLVQSLAHKVDKIDMKGHKLYSYRGSHHDFKPAHITAGPLGNFWISEQARHRIQVFGPYGNLIAGLGSFGAGEGQFDQPQGMAFKGLSKVKAQATPGQGDINAQDIMVYVVDQGNQRIEKFQYAKASGEVLTPRPTATPAAELEILGLTVQPSMLTVEEGHSTLIQYMVTRAAHVQVMVLSREGDRIRDFGVTYVQSTGLIQSQTWNLRNQYGQLVNPGNYVIKAFAHDAGQSAVRQVNLTLLKKGHHHPHPKDTATPQATATPQPTATNTPQPTATPDLKIISLAINPDPFKDDATSTATITYELTQAATVELTIINNQGLVAYHLTGIAGHVGMNTAYWQGTEAPNTTNQAPYMDWVPEPHSLQVKAVKGSASAARAIAFTKEVWRFIPGKKGK